MILKYHAVNCGKSLNEFENILILNLTQVDEAAANLIAMAKIFWHNPPASLSVVVRKLATPIDGPMGYMSSLPPFAPNPLHQPTSVFGIFRRFHLQFLGFPLLFHL